MSLRLTPRFLLIMFLAIPLLGASIKEDVERSISAHFPGKIELKYERIPLEDQLKQEIEGLASQRFMSKEVHGWWVSKADGLVGLALVDNVMGKAMPITIMVVFDIEGVIVGTEVVRYRESIGGEVSQSRWLSQFSGLSEQELVHEKHRIDGISGATISVKSVHKGVKKLSLLHTYLRPEEVEHDG